MWPDSRARTGRVFLCISLIAISRVANLLLPFTYYPALREHSLHGSYGVVSLISLSMSRRCWIELMTLKCKYNASKEGSE